MDRQIDTLDGKVGESGESVWGGGWQSVDCAESCVRTSELAYHWHPLPRGHQPRLPPQRVRLSLVYPRRRRAAGDNDDPD